LLMWKWMYCLFKWFKFLLKLYCFSIISHKNC
jgi:hypothetical protein